MAKKGRKPPNRARVVYGRHLDTPLTQNNILFYMTHHSHLVSRYTSIDPSWLYDLQTGKVDDICVLSWLYSHIRSHATNKQLTESMSFETILEIVQLSVENQVKALATKIPAPTTRDLEQIMNRVSGSEEVMEAYYEKLAIVQVHNDLARMDQDKEAPWRIPSLPTVQLCGDLVVLDEFPGHPLVITYDMLLAVLDKVECQFSYHITVLLMDSVAPYSGIGFKKFMDTVKGTLEEMYQSLGNGSHYVLKSLEPIAVGNLLLQEPIGRSSRGFLGDVLDSISGKHPDCGLWAAEVSALMGEMLRDHPDHGRKAVLEAYGLEKSIGFPIVDDEGGQIKMYMYGTSYRSVNQAGCQKIKGYFIQEIVWSLFSKTNRLPPIIHSLFYHEGIQRIYEEEYIPTRDSIFSIPPEEWSRVVFRKVFEFDYRPDDMDHLLDKAIAPQKSSINQIWHPDVRSAYNLPKPQNICDRRFPEWILNQPKIDSKKYFQDWEQEKDVPLEERVILATAKEREQKVESRSFSILPAITRIIMTTIEHNISESILPLLPNHSMSLSGAQLEKRIESLVSSSPRGTTVKVSFMMDFDQWNYTFRDRATYMFDDLLDRLFDVKHFQWPNKIFQRATFYTGNPFTPPESDVQFTSWSNHIGGNQGMRQKFWTMITQAAIALAMEKMSYRYQLIGSGDNQVLVVEIPVSDQIEVIVNRIKQAIYETTSWLGISLKLSETYHSSRIFVYGRKYYIEGHPVSLGIKATVRAAAGTSEGIPTINQLISTSQNSGMQICSATSHPFIGLIAGHLESYTSLLAHYAGAPFRSLDVQTLASLSLFCSDLSPLNFMQLPGHLYSGHKDVLTENLSMLKIIYDEDRSMAEAMSGLLSVEYGDITPESSLALALDPKSPNLNWPQSSESYIKKALREYIRDVKEIRNDRVSNMINYSSDEAINQYAASLLTIRPLNLTVVHSLCESSMFGQVLGVINRFVKLRTMTKMANKARITSEGVPFYKIIESRDTNMIKHLAKVLQRKTYNRGNFFECLFSDRYLSYNSWCVRYAHFLMCTSSARKYLMIDSYQLDVADILGPYCPAPLEQIAISAARDGEDLTTSIMITPRRLMPASIDDCEIKRGPFSKYVGSGTSSRMHTFKLLNLSGGDFSTAVNTLMALGTWFSLNGNCPNLLSLIREELNCRAPGLQDVLDQIMISSRGGCMEHRYSSPGDVIGSYSSNQSLISTHYRLSTDSATLFGRSDDDFELFFQPLLQCIYGLLRFQIPTNTRLKATIEMAHCTRPIATSNYQLPAPLAHCTSPYPVGDLIDKDIRVAMVQLIKREYLVPGPEKLRIPSREIGLLATLAASSVVYIKNYQCYKAYSDNSFMKQTRPESILNLSLVREVPLPNLLYSVVVSLDYYGVLGKCSSRHAIASKFRNWARSVSGLIDIRMFKFLIDAIVQTGQVALLCRIAKVVPRFAVVNRTHVLTPVLFSAFANLITESRWKSVQWSLLIRDDNRSIHKQKMSRFLRHWVSKFWRAYRQDPNVDSLEFISSKGHSIKEGWFLTSNLIDKVEEISRTLSNQSHLISGQGDVSWGHDSMVVVPEYPDFTTQAKCKVAQYGFGDNIQQTGGGDIAMAIQWNVGFQRMYQMARFNGPVSGAWTKLAVIISEFKSTIGRCSRILCLAEGGASVMRYLLHAFPKLIGVFNTLYIADETDGLDDCGFIPPGLLCPCGVKDRVINLPYLDMNMGDISNTGTLRHLSQWVDKLPLGPMILTMDMQDWGAGRLTAVIRAINHFMPYTIQVAIIKLYSGDLVQDELADAIQDWTRSYEVLIRKPVTSNPVSQELYLVLTLLPQSRKDIDPRPSLASARKFISILKKVSPYNYMQDLIQFCRIDHGLPKCMRSGSISTGYNAEPCKFTSPPLFEAFSIIHTVRRNLTSTTDLLSRELGVLFDSNSHGSLALLENYQSLLYSVLAVYLLSGESLNTGSKLSRDLSLSSFNGEFSKVVPEYLKAFKIPSSVDVTWRRIGELYSTDKAIHTLADLHFLASINHYQRKMPSTLLDKYMVPSHLQVILSLHKYRLMHEGARSLTTLLFSKGLNLLSSTLANAGAANKGPCRIIKIEPAWVEDILVSKDWPVKFSNSGSWGIVITDDPNFQPTKPGGVNKVYVIFHPVKSGDISIEEDEDSMEYSMKMVGKNFSWFTGMY